MNTGVDPQSCGHTVKIGSVDGTNVIKWNPYLHGAALELRHPSRAVDQNRQARPSFWKIGLVALGNVHDLEGALAAGVIRAQNDPVRVQCAQCIPRQPADDNSGWESI